MKTKTALTPGQQRFLTRLSDGTWHTFNGRGLRVAERLDALGLIEYEYLPGGAFGMPNWFRARLIPSPKPSISPASSLSGVAIHP